MTPSLLTGETAMDTFDWRTQLPSDSRPRIVNKIMETLKKYLPAVPEPEAIKIATRFEEGIFINAASQSDYLRKISMKMMTMENKTRNAAGSSSSVLATDNSTTSDKANVVGDMGSTSTSAYVGNLMNNNNLRPSLPNGEPAIEANDWRAQLLPDSRDRIVNKIMETLKKHLPFSGPEGLNELRRIAARFEEKIYSGAVNQTDYLRKISMKMLTMETRSHNPSSSSIPFDLGHLMDIDVTKHSLPSEELAMNTGEWRTQLPADSRQKIVNKIMENLMKHFPNAGQQRIEERMGFASRFEELVFNTAINQEDYLCKISLKMQAME